MAKSIILDGVDPKKAWIQVGSGGQFHILEPQQDEIFIEDIGYALSKMCRFTGHTRKFYSVAEHSVYVSRVVPAKDALWGLMHDASESYIADLNRPLKHFTQVGPTYMEVEKIVQDAICVKFRLPLEQPASVHDADNALLYAEKTQLLPPMDWGTKWGKDDKPADVKIKCWSPEVAAVEFLHRFYELTGQI